MDDLISIIVPVYKVEAYLDQCVQSIIHQTYQNLEIILVDDGSPDNCPAMCNAWAEKDSRIRVLHKQNGGLSDARNAGMAIATGEYIGFVDSDDYIAPNMYEVLHSRLVETGSDIAACGVTMVWEDGHTTPLTMAGTIILNPTEAMEASLRETWLKQPVWNKLYKADLIRDIPFPPGKCHEDVFWSYQAIGRAARISVFDEPYYCYVQREGSIMGQNYSLKRLDSLEAKVQRVGYIQQCFPTLLPLAKQSLWEACLYANQMLLRCCTPEVQREGQAIIQAILRRYPIQLSSLKNISAKQFIWLTATKLSLQATCRIRNWLNIGF